MNELKYLIHFNNGEIIDIDDFNCLKHFGVPGMKWGVRKVKEYLKNRDIKKTVKVNANFEKRMKKFKGIPTKKNDILVGGYRDPGPLFSRNLKRLNNKNKKILADIYKKQISNYEKTKPTTRTEKLLSQMGKTQMSMMPGMASNFGLGTTGIYMPGDLLMTTTVTTYSEAPTISALRYRLDILQKSRKKK